MGQEYREQGWECGKSRQECGESEWECGECEEWGRNAGNLGGDVGNQGGSAWNSGGNIGNIIEIEKNRMKVQKIRFILFFAEIKKDKIRIVIKRYYFLSNQKHKPKFRFSNNDPNQQYYLNGICTCGPSVLILFQLFQSQFSSNEKLYFAKGCCVPKGFKLKYYIIVAGSNCNFNRDRASVGVPSKCSCIKQK